MRFRGTQTETKAGALCLFYGKSSHLVACRKEGSTLRSGEMIFLFSMVENEICTKVMHVCATIARQVFGLI